MTHYTSYRDAVPSETNGMAKRRPVFLAAVALAAWSAAAIWYFYSNGWLAYYGDAEAHLNIARRLVDANTPLSVRIGVVWLPLPHVLMAPFARIDALWLNGLAGALPTGACFVVAGTFLFAAARRAFRSQAAGVTAAALFALNPNLMYVQSTAMTEAVFSAALCGLLYFTVRFRETQSWGALTGAALAAAAGAMTRYEGWFVLPFAALYLFFAAKQRRMAVVAIFSAIAGAGPLWWLAHHWWVAGDALDFYRGPYSAHTIQAGKPYPGKGDWYLAGLYYGVALRLCVGLGLACVAIAGAVAALARRVFWPLALLALPCIFYVWSVHGSDTPIYVPELWPYTFYNSRYGLAALPFCAFAAAALAPAAPKRARLMVAAALIAAGSGWWALHPGPDHWITWTESRVNSEARRAWIDGAAAYLGPRYVRGSGIVSSFGDLTGIYRKMGIPLREVTTGEDGPIWLSQLSRPDLFLWEEWAVAAEGDPVDRAVQRASSYGVRYRLEMSIAIDRERPIRIYRRVGGPHGKPPLAEGVVHGNA